MSFSSDQTFTESLCNYLRDVLISKDLQDEFRGSPKDFIRHRMLTFTRTLVLLVTGQKRALQNRINQFFTDLGETDGSPTATALLKARDKVRPVVFKRLTNQVGSFFYDHFEDYGTCQHYKGRRLVAVDGSVHNLPNTPETREAFTVIDNKSGRRYVQALASYLYDVLQDLPLNAELGPFQAEKNFIFRDHAPFLRSEDILILDRLYADYEVLARIQRLPGDVVVRASISSGFKVVKEFAQDSAREDERVTLTLSSRQQKKHPDLPAQISVRLVKVYLSTGEVEVLITSLFDQQQYPPEDFKWIYHQRWNEETYIGQLKHHWDIERVSSGKVNRILQDFYASVFLSALSLALAAESEALVRSQTSERPRQYAYKLNKSVISSSVAMNVVQILLGRRDTLSQRVAFLQDLLIKALVPIRPDRSFDRKEAPLRQQIKYLRYEKKLWA